MATSRSLNVLLNDYLAYDMLWNDQIKRNWLFGKLEEKGKIDRSWNGGPIPVPFAGSIPTSIEFGQLPSETDIAELTPVRGEVSDYKEAWATMFFHDRDLMEHDGKVKEKSFLKSVDQVYDQFQNHIKETVSMGLLNSKNITSIVSGGNSATGDIVVTHPERLNIHEKIEINDGTNSNAGYVKTINMNTGAVKVVTARGGATGVNLSTPAYAAGTKIYKVGARANGFTALPDQLLPSSAGGSTTIFGVTKTDWPQTQCYAVSGSGYNASNLLGNLFDVGLTARRIGRGNPTDLLMSYKHWGTIVKALESASGAYKNIEMKANPYGYSEVLIGGTGGTFNCVAIPEKDDDTIIGLDWDSIMFRTNKGIRRVVDPDGNEYYKLRSTSGYKYIVDHCLYGEMIVHRPCSNMIIHSIASY